jgi:hypothetical protein
MVWALHLMINLCELVSDAVLFWVLQAGLLFFALFAALWDWIAARGAGHGGLNMQVDRGAESMGYFLVICGADYCATDSDLCVG